MVLFASQIFPVFMGPAIFIHFEKKKEKMALFSFFFLLKTGLESWLLIMEVSRPADVSSQIFG